MATSESTSIRSFWTPLRQAGAVAHTLLISAAGQAMEQWGVDPVTSGAERGVVTDTSGSHSLADGELVDVAAALPVRAPESVALKNPQDFKLLGTLARRLDTPDKVNGKVVFGIDARLPGMKIAAIAIAPYLAAVQRQSTRQRRWPSRVTEALAAYLEKQGAKVELELHDGGHEVRQGETDAIPAFFLREG